MRPRLRALIAFVATALTTTAVVILPHGALPMAAAAETSVNAVRLNGFEGALVADINNARRARGLRILVVAPGTTDVARRWAWHLAGAQQLSHNPSIASDLQRAGSAAWTMLSENVGMGPIGDPGRLFSSYMGSPMHRANILDPSARYLGVGVVQRGSYAWNTLDFTNAYTTTYGRTRVPPAGLSTDGTTPWSTTMLASYEGGPDQRMGIWHNGALTTSLVGFTGPSSSNDHAYANVRRTGSLAGHVDLFLRDAVNLAHVSSLVLQLSSHDPLGRRVAVQVLVSRAYGTTVSLGTLSVGSTTQTFRLALPAAAHTLRDTVTLRLTSQTVQAAGGSVGLNVYAVTAAT